MEFHSLPQNWIENMTNRIWNYWFSCHENKLVENFGMFQESTTFSFHVSRFVAISTYDCGNIDFSLPWWLIWLVRPLTLLKSWLSEVGFLKSCYRTHCHWSIIVFHLTLYSSNLFSFHFQEHVLHVRGVIISCVVTKVSHESGKAPKIKSNFISSSISLLVDNDCSSANCLYLFVYLTGLLA